MTQSIKRIIFVGMTSVLLLLTTGRWSHAACSGGPVVYTCLSEADYLAKVTELGYITFHEGFEVDATWFETRAGTRPFSVTSQGITWTPNNATSRIATSLGGALTGSYGIYSTPHGITTGIPDVTEQRDGFVGTRTGTSTLIGVGGWVKGSSQGAKVRFVLDGTEYGFTDATLSSAHKFFGVIDQAGFVAFEVFETEGRVKDLKSIFADDFALAFDPRTNATRKTRLMLYLRTILGTFQPTP